MFHHISTAVQARMTYLETIDARDRQDGTPRPERLRQIPAETGKFLALLAANAPEGEIVEVGTSGGYSTLWLTLACRANGRSLTTFELLANKVALAHETLRLTEATDVVELIQGDARDYLAGYNEIAFCFLDAEKDIYADCYELIIPRLVPSGLLVADNAINHQHLLAPMLERAHNDERVDSLIVPIGNGELVCRKVG